MISARRSGTIVVRPPMGMPRLRTFANPHIAQVRMICVFCDRIPICRIATRMPLFFFKSFERVSAFGGEGDDAFIGG
jgi:hypothetical protein